MIDFSVYKPPEEYKLNHDAGIVNAMKWSVSGWHRGVVCCCPWYRAGSGLRGGQAPD
jgi:hypothetical protein